MHISRRSLSILCVICVAVGCSSSPASREASATLAEPSVIAEYAGAAEDEGVEQPTEADPAAAQAQAPADEETPAPALYAVVGRGGAGAGEADQGTADHGGALSEARSGARAPRGGRPNASRRPSNRAFDEVVAVTPPSRRQRVARPAPAIAAPGGYGTLAPPAEPVLPQNGVLASNFVGGRGAQARLEDLLDRGVMVNGENVRLEAFHDLGRLPYPVPASEAVGMYAELERSRLSADRERVHLQIALMAHRGEAPPRPRMDVRLVLDRSGSMSGEKWSHAIAAAHQLVDRLQPNDTFGLISYADEASLDFAPGTVRDRSRAHAAISSLAPGGGTNIEAALRMAQSVGPRRHAMNDVLLTVLVSDGVATIGQTNPQALGAISRALFDASGTMVTSVGLGTDFDEATMLAIAREGSGSYHFVRRAPDISEILQDELEERAQAVAQALRLRIELGDGVVARHVYGSHLLNEAQAAAVRHTEIATDQRLARELGIARDRQQNEERGLRVHLPSFRRGDQHVVLMELEVPAGSGASEIAHVTLDYKDLLARRNREVDVRVRAERTNDREAAVASTERTVKRTVLAFQAGETLRGASSALERGDVVEARRQLAERQRVLDAAASLWSDEALRADANLLSRYDRVLASAWPSWDNASRRTMVMAMNFYGDRRMR